ncbi:MAG: class I SAM-dependent RNA methyltransferase [Desulfobacterales bacterium]|nr:class I SAM-dependent RNA methyltransferase [Desulfobacterales bacterium]
MALDELRRLGATRVKAEYRGASFSADPAVLYGINYQSRLVTRVLAPLVSFTCDDRDDIYRAGKSVDWVKFLPVDGTFAIFSNVSGNDQITHSNFASLCLKDAVADYYTSRFGIRPNVEKLVPDMWVSLHVEKTRGLISVDTSGGSLHRRGYRQESVAAPMQEILAAAMVTLSGWRGERPLYDPMCGSGTLLCEAMMAYCRMPSGYLRKKFGFTRLPDFDRRLWDQVKRTADQAIRPLPPGLVAGSDVDRGAIRAAEKNRSLLPGGKEIKVIQRDFNDLNGLENNVILCNPPYGIRMQHPDDLGEFYKGMGDFLKQRCKGSSAFIFIGNREMIKRVGLKPSWKRPMKNAGLDGRLVKYELF